MKDSVEVAISFWEKTADTAQSTHARGDEVLKFYIGSGTAFAAWLLTNTLDSPVSIFALLALGVLGTGHVAYYHNRGFRLQQRANRIAREIASLVDVSEIVTGWHPSDDLKTKNLLVPGHPAAQIIFNALAVLFIHLIYVGVLYIKIVGV